MFVFSFCNYLVSFAGKRSSSAKVFNALSWSWSFKSSQSSQGASDSNVSGEPCRPGAHCITLERLHAAEQKLYKELKVKNGL